MVGRAYRLALLATCGDGGSRTLRSTREQGGCVERQVLVVCTANLCRSPVAAALLARQFDGMVDVDGRRWTVASAGTTAHRADADPDTASAAASIGLDLGDHRPRVVAAADVEHADLILTMTRAQLRQLVAEAPGAWPKTFTLRELLRRAQSLPRAETVEAWLAAAGAGRRAADVMRASADDDIADPYRCGRAANDAMVRELAVLTTELARLGPWRQR
jgi:low molecular weight protein-tyrosine phosphatase